MYSKKSINNNSISETQISTDNNELTLNNSLTHSHNTNTSSIYSYDSMDTSLTSSHLQNSTDSQLAYSSTNILSNPNQSQELSTTNNETFNLDNWLTEPIEDTLDSNFINGKNFN